MLKTHILKEKNTWEAKNLKLKIAQNILNSEQKLHRRTYNKIIENK